MYRKTFVFQIRDNRKELEKWSWISEPRCLKHKTNGTSWSGLWYYYSNAHQDNMAQSSETRNVEQNMELIPEAMMEMNN